MIIKNIYCSYKAGFKLRNFPFYKKKSKKPFRRNYHIFFSRTKFNNELSFDYLLLLFFVSFMSVFKSAAFLFFSPSFKANNLSSSFCREGINSDARLKIVILAARSVSSNEGMLFRRLWKRCRRSFRRFRSRSLCEIRAFPSSFSCSDDSLLFFLDRSFLGGTFKVLPASRVVSDSKLVVFFSVLPPVTLTTSISSSSVNEKKEQNDNIVL